ncbi:MAG TPA: DoxX family protein [Chloroflexota bacterium]|jgi:putative oxidoreductase|nr:DoxX family protein [Chloroflexota bacterium]
MLETAFAPYAGVGLLILRVGLALVFWAHGWPKLNPNGPMKGPGGFAGFLAQIGVPVPIAFAWLVALLETVGSVLLALGVGTRILALALAIDMLVAIVRVRRPTGASFSSMQNIGWEFEFALLVGALALVFTGAGNLALDPLIGL